MATTVITVEVDDIVIADHVISNLGWDWEYRSQDDSGNVEIVLASQEGLSCARMRGIFWIEYADVAEVRNG